MSILVLLALFGVVSCNIKIDISVSYETGVALVEARGYERHAFTPEIEDVLGLPKNGVRIDALSTPLGPVTFIGVRNASALGGCSSLYATVVPVSSNITAIEYEPVLLWNRTYSNMGNEPVTYETKISEPRVERIIVGWSVQNNTYVKGGILINFENRIQHVSRWDINETKHRVRTMSPPHNVTFTVQPGRNVTLSVYALRVLLHVKVEYLVTLDGLLFFKKHNFFIADEEFSLDVNEYFRITSAPYNITGKQYIIVDFYFEARVLVEDDENGEFVIEPIDFM